MLQLSVVSNRLDMCRLLLVLKTLSPLFPRLQQSTPLIMLCIPTGIRRVMSLECMVTLEVEGRGAAIIISLVPGKVRVMETVTLLALGVKLSKRMLGLFYYMLDRNRLKECRSCGLCYRTVWLVLVNTLTETSPMFYVAIGTSTLPRPAGRARMLNRCGSEKLQTLVLTMVALKLRVVNAVVRPVAIEDPLMLFPLEVTVKTWAPIFGPSKGPCPCLVPRLVIRLVSPLWSTELILTRGSSRVFGQESIVLPTRPATALSSGYLGIASLMRMAMLQALVLDDVGVVVTVVTTLRLAIE